jgi:hypothetical protein
LWQKATTFHLLPSQVVRERNALVAHMLDNAVTYFGITLGNALQERIETGNGKSIARYTLSELLDDRTRLPRDDAPMQGMDVTAMVGVDGMMFDEVK